MAVRLEKSGGLIFIKGRQDEPKPKKRSGLNMCLWLVLVALVAGIYFVPAKGLDPTAVHHTINELLSAIR